MQNPEYLKKSFLKAYEDYSDAIFRHCYFRLSNRERAQELMQETFMKTWEYIAGGKVVENMRAFLYRLANNLVIDEVRKKKELSLENLTNDGFQPTNTDDKLMNIVIEVSEITKIIGNLPVQYKEVLIMRYIDDLSPKQIAEMTQESENVVSVRINRAMKQLRTLLNTKENDL